MTNKKIIASILPLIIWTVAIFVLVFIVIIILSGPRPPKPDEKRVTDIKHTQTGFQLFFEEYGKYPECDSATAINEMATNENCTKYTSPADLTTYLPGIKNIKDPSKKENIALCTANSTSVCEYSFQDNSADTSNYRIYFYLEETVESFDKGVHVATPNGIE